MATNRDRSIESLLRRREGDVPQSTDQCVDAESLAAWMESGLTADARATVEKHAAGCLRCQALLASMARTEPHEEPRPWWRSVTAKWLVPIAAVATAFVVDFGRTGSGSKTAFPALIADRIGECARACGDRAISRRGGAATRLA